MADYSSYYLQTEGGRSPVEEFIDSLHSIIFMHAMKKKTQKIPPQELVVAIQRKNAYRLDARNKKEG